MNENIDLLNIKPISSTSSSYSTSSCSSSSSTSSSCRYPMAKNQSNSTTNYNQCSTSSQDNLNLVVNDLKQISSTLNLLARQIDQVVHKIDCNFIQDKNNLNFIKNFTKIINPNNLNVDKNNKNANLNKANSLNRNENIINNYLALNNQKVFSDRVVNSKEFVDSCLSNQRNEAVQRTKCPRSKSQPAFKDATILAPSSTTTNLNRAFEVNNTSSPISAKFLTNENGDSSFYEDQLDNELESIDDNSINAHNLSSALSNKKHLSPNSGIQKSKAKVPGSNHHVSFNINNAIYTSKQDTPIPIPISILKQAKLNEQANSSSSSSSNVSPQQSAMKKSPALNFSSVSDFDSKNGKCTSKSVRLDKKTTIL